MRRVRELLTGRRARTRAARTGTASSAIRWPGIVVAEIARPAAGGLRHRDRDPSPDGDAAAAAHRTDGPRWAGRAVAGLAGDRGRRLRARPGCASRTRSCARRAPGCRTACGCCRCSSSTASTPTPCAALAARRSRRPPPARSASPSRASSRSTSSATGRTALVGGTTGSGKSELLRSLIAALAANADPRQLTFLLMDFKGGGAFDGAPGCRTPSGWSPTSTRRSVERALRALEAELQYRERLLRSAGADNLRAYRRARRTTSRCPGSWS